MLSVSLLKGGTDSEVYKQKLINRNTKIQSQIDNITVSCGFDPPGTDIGAIHGWFLNPLFYLKYISFRFYSIKIRKQCVTYHTATACNNRTSPMRRYMLHPKYDYKILSLSLSVQFLFGFKILIEFTITAS